MPLQSDIAEEYVRLVREWILCGRGPDCPQLDILDKLLDAMTAETKTTVRETLKRAREEGVYDEE